VALSSLQLNKPFANDKEFPILAISSFSSCPHNLGSQSSFSLKDSPTFDTKSLNEILSSMHVLFDDPTFQELLKQGPKNKQNLYEGFHKFQDTWKIKLPGA
jgi:hypothetical protein